MIDADDWVELDDGRWIPITWEGGVPVAHATLTEAERDAADVLAWNARRASTTHPAKMEAA